MSLFPLRILFLNLIFCLSSLAVNAQIFNNDADQKDTTAYSKHDTIYIFYSGKVANLKAVCPKGGLASFSWSKFDTINLTFSAPFKTETNVLSSSVSGIEKGGYKVHITNSVLDTSFIAWVFLDKLSVALEKDSKGNVPYYRCTCYYTDFFATASSPTFKYYNPKSGEPLFLNNPLTYKWWSANTNFINKSAHLRDNDPPYRDTYYYVKVTDSFGLYDTDTVLYKSIVTKADFSWTGDSVVSGKNSAPFKVTFTNNSINGLKYTWYFANIDTFRTTERTPLIRTFYQPKTYYISLVSESSELCTDTIIKEIKVDKPQIECPNVFTPGGKNPYFKISNISIRKFRIIIFSRWGKKVYEQEGENMLDWEGWDGNIGGSQASDGAYYYTLEVYTWDKAPDPTLIHTNGRYNGFFYLFRAK
ncbi:MAG: gliding motility-associated C-terminal domain-containing protein [Bacteroidota bacterium]|nr:gliding motility-associated C-terminal domain-containing protein [Bacteroidota bacterium]